MQENVSISKKEYETLIYKSLMYDEIVETEELTKEEVENLEKARMGRSISEEEFLTRHPELR